MRFVFDVAGRAGGTERYVVARELRRAASGGVSVRTARLERLRDPAGTGAVEEETEPVADGAPATTKAVEELLGLPFGDFTTCVVLPQGDFAEFLHTEPRKRQETLVRLLGLGVYDAIAKEANAEAPQPGAAGAGAHRAARGLPRRHSGGRAGRRGAGPRAGRAGRARGRGGAELAAAPRPRRRRRAVRRARGEQELLRPLTRPAGLDRLRRAGARGEHRRPGRRPSGSPPPSRPTAPRGPGSPRPRTAAGLERLRHDHAELAAGRAELPGLIDRAEKALADYELAAQDAADAQLAVDRARAAREVAAAAVPPAQETVRRLVAERAGFHGVRVPERLDELDARQAAAGGALRRAESRWPRPRRRTAGPAASWPRPRPGHRWNGRSGTGGRWSSWRRAGGPR